MSPQALGFRASVISCLQSSDLAEFGLRDDTERKAAEAVRREDMDRRATAQKRPPLREAGQRGWPEKARFFSSELLQQGSGWPHPWEFASGFGTLSLLNSEAHRFWHGFRIKAMAQGFRGSSLSPDQGPDEGVFATMI